MKIAIIYATSRGTTELAATKLAAQLDGDVKIVNIKKNKNVSLAEYDAVIIGSSIHIGSIQSSVKKFILANQTELLSKKLGLFLCCMYDGEKAEQQFELGFPEDLRTHATASGLFGGEFDFKKMNLLEKFIIKKVSGTTTSVSTVSDEEISSFAKTFNNK